MQVKDILNKLRSLEEADEKDSKRKVDPTNGAGEGDPFATSAINSTRTKPVTGSSGDTPKFKPDPTGLDGAAGDMPKFKPDPTGLDGAAGDAVAGGAAAGGVEKAIDTVLKDPSNPDAKKVQDKLSTSHDPEIQTLVISLDAIDRVLQKNGIKVDTIAETVYRYYRENINNFLTPQEQIKNWSMLSEVDGKQQLDETLAGTAARMASRRLARRLERQALRRAERAAARNAMSRAARSSTRSLPRTAATRSAVDDTPLWKSPWVRGGLALGGAISLAPAALELWDSLKKLFSSKSEEDPGMPPPMSPQTGPGPEDPNKPKDSNNPNDPKSNNPQDPNSPTDDPASGDSKNDIKIVMKHFKIVLPYFQDAKFHSLPEEIQIRLTKTYEGIQKFMEKVGS